MKLVQAGAVLVLAASSGQVHAGKDRIADEGRIGDTWMLAEGASLSGPDYPAAFLERGADACMALGYRIMPDGTTSDFTVLKQWNSQGDDKEPIEGFWEAFAQSSASALSQWRFTPRPGTGAAQPTYTVATFGFTAGKDTSVADAQQHCRIGDLAAHLKRRDREILEWGRHGRREAYQADRAAGQGRNEAVIRDAQSRQPPPTTSP